MSTISTGTLLTTAFVVKSDLSGTLQIQTGASSANAVYIDSSQNVGIGNISPSTKLDVTGNVLLSAANSFLRFNAGGPQLYVTVGNTLQFSMNGGGSEAMRIDNNGNLGIGTTSPSVRLDVQDTAAIARVTSTTGTNAVRYQVINTGGTSQFGRESSGGGTILSGADGYSTVLTGTGAYPMVFGTNSAERMRIDSSGNVGIGVTPSAWLSTVKAIQLSNRASIYTDSSGNTIVGNNSFVNSSSQDTYLQTAQASAYLQGAGQHKWYNAPSGTAGNAITFTQAMTLDASGNLGIGTSSITGKLNITGTESGGFTGITTYSALNSAAAKTDYIQFKPSIELNTAAGEAGGYTILVKQQGAYKNSIVASGVTNNGSNYLSFSTTNEAMRIDTSGNIVIGSITAGTQKLTVASSSAEIGINLVNTGSTGRTYELISGGSGGAFAGGLFGIYDRTAAAARLAIDSSGNVGIGTTSPIGKLDINANASTAAFAVATNSNGSLPSATPSGLVIGQNYGGGSAGSAEIDFIFNSSTYVGDNGGFRFYQRTGASTVNEMMRMTQNALYMYTGGTERMRITSTGSVGIGTSSPSNTLQVVGGIGSTGGSVTSSGAAITMYYDTSNDYGVTSVLNNGVAWKQYVIRSAGLIFKTSSDVEAARFDTSGQLGIGTTSPIRKLTVSTAGSCEFVLQDSSQGTDSKNWRIFNTGAQMYLGTLNDAGSAGTDVMIMDRTGRVRMPNQPYLHATVNSGVAGPNFAVHNTVTIPYNSIITNTGNYFNTSTYTFTCPVAGVYLVYASIQIGSMQGTSGVGPNFQIVRNGTVITGTYNFILTGTGYQKEEGTAYVKCAANDTLCVNYYTGSAMTGGGAEFNGDVRNALCIAFIG
jgi:hypothetical protein